MGETSNGQRARLVRPADRELLGSVRFRHSERPPIHEIAALFATRVESEYILQSIPDPMSGDEVERERHHLEESQKLAASDNRDVRAIGEAGINIYTPRVAAAEQKAREREIRGDIWY
jgi:hypothetical protein